MGAQLKAIKNDRTKATPHVFRDSSPNKRSAKDSASIRRTFACNNLVPKLGDSGYPCGGVFRRVEIDHIAFLAAQHVDARQALCARVGVAYGAVWPWAAGSDVFVKRQSAAHIEGESIADQYAALGLDLSRANVDRVNGAGRLLELLGDVEQGIAPASGSSAAAPG